MRAVRFNYINPETLPAPKNFSTSEVSTNPTQAIIFQYGNSIEKSANRVLCAKSIHFIGEKPKPAMTTFKGTPPSKASRSGFEEQK